MSLEEQPAIIHSLSVFFFYIYYITVSAFTSTKITSEVISPEEHPDAAPGSKPFPGKLFHVVVVTIHLLVGL